MFLLLLLLLLKLRMMRKRRRRRRRAAAPIFLLCEVEKKRFASFVLAQVLVKLAIGEVVGIVREVELSNLRNGRLRLLGRLVHAGRAAQPKQSETEETKGNVARDDLLLEDEGVLHCDQDEGNYLLKERATQQDDD
jgi:hypothetical protein